MAYTLTNTTRFSVVKHFCLALLGAFLMVSSSFASILPSANQQKWEVNLDGFGTLSYDGSNWLLGSLTKVTSDFKSQGVVTTPSQFQPGIDSPAHPGHVPDYQTTEVTGVLLSGLKVIAVDNFNGSGWDRYSAPGDITTQLGSLNVEDIVYFGSATADPNDARANFYADASVTNGDLVPGGHFEDDGKSYYDLPIGGTPLFGQDAASNLLLQATFQDLDSTRVDSTSRTAPAGTLLAQYLNDVNSHTFAMLDVVPNIGSEWGQIVDQGMKFSLLTDTNGDGNVGPGTVSKTFVGDIAISLAATVPDTTGFSTFSDPAEFVSTPEPVSLIAWSGLICAVGVGVFVRRLKQS